MVGLSELKSMFFLGVHGRAASGCFQKSWYPQIINFNRVFHYKPSILVVFPLFLETSKYELRVGVVKNVGVLFQQKKSFLAAGERSNFCE